MTLSLPTINWVRFPEGDTGIPEATRGLEDLLTTASDAGFGAVGIDLFTLEASGLKPAGVADALDSRGLRCTDVGVLSVGSDDGLAAAERLGGLAAAVGAPVCVTVIDVPPSADVAARLRASADVLAEYGVRMALEFLPYGPLSALEDTVDLCGQVGWSNCGVLLDSWHFFNSGSPWQVLSEMDGEQIAFVQINDAPPPITDDQRFESRFRRVVPGAGRFDLRRFLESLAAIGYRGVISPEVLSTDLQRRDPRDAAVMMRDALIALGVGGGDA
ncbi:TIM barrel protein [Nakamurella sp. YIM 132087]|uniref:TIM barrel protein n=1 Tax=Nakamurella alba TaxID=2665158 RepID=A0A7K1FV53_9ACTN|nr:sugar phosphate isomerase/epimerase family protein [Nakamurella alba]MTD17239.1 TIM barrel protein [Nakamurella alba]